MPLLILYGIVTAFFAVANLPVLFFLLRKDTPMPVLPEFQSIVDELSTLTTAVTALKAQADAAASAPSSQDLSDTAAALQAGADAIKTAAGQ